MAIFHLTHCFLRRGLRTSSIATAAYNSGKKLEDGKGSSKHSDYTRKGGVLFDEILLPTGTPAWADNRGELWRRLEAREDKSTRPEEAILAHNFNIALPHELTLEQNIFLARDFVREQFTRKGFAVDWAIHAADPRGDDRNIHLHILVPLRRIRGESFGNKERYTRGQLRHQVITWRKSWAALVNRHLRRYGHNVTIDERSLRAQGIKRPPTRHRGPLPKTKRAILEAMLNRQPARPTSPIARPSYKPVPGGTTLREIIGRTETERASNQSNHGIRPHSGTKGWPPAAIADWQAWGHRNPVKFFALWPELGSGNGPRI